MKSFSETKVMKIATGKCPNCSTGDVFEKRPKYAFKLPQMKENCDVCGYHFEKEPGYFYGAMYVSYGLTVAESIALFLLCKLLPLELSYNAIIGIIASALVLLAVTNYKLSRVIWMNII